MRVKAQTQSETRQRLLDAAAEAFAERGYHDTRIDAVSEAAGVAKGTIYNYFPSKEVVLQTLVAEACQLAGAAAHATPPDASTQTQLEAFVAENLRWARRRRALALLFARELLAGDEQMKRLIRRAAAPCITQVGAIIHAGINRGEIRSGAAPETLAFTFICLTNMLLLQIWDMRADWPRAADLPQTAATLFLQGVGASPPSQV